MNFSVITEGDPRCESGCAARCQAPIRPGDVVLEIDQGPEVYVHRTLYLHRRCVVVALEAAPLERSEVSRKARILRERGPLRLVVG